MDAKQIAELWEPLAEKIGRPEGLEQDGMYGYVLAGETVCRGHGDYGKPMAPPAIAAALWRDHAVRWLLTRRMYVSAPCGNSSNPQTAAWGLWVTGVYPKHLAYLGSSIDTDYDHALAAACRAVSA